jgi:hypothetical protein
MGPVLLLDKSTFQMLSKEEHFIRERFFFENITPILVTEILGDLSKAMSGGRSAAAKVAELSAKFLGSGNPLNHDARLLAVQSLIGNDVPMTGQVLARGGTYVPGEHPGWFFDIGEWNKAIMRWREGEFTEFERQYAELWRETTHRPGFPAIWEGIYRSGVILPRVANAGELKKALEEITSESGLQDVWLTILLKLLQPRKAEEAHIRRRWDSAFQSLRTFAPYAYHYLKASVSLVMAVRSGLFKWAPTHILDLQYLTYLPFCNVFSSDDKLHRLLAPILIREDQTFLPGAAFKATLRAESEAWKALDDATQTRYRYAFSCPIPDNNSLLFTTWNRYCTQWGGGNGAIPLSDEEKKRARPEAFMMLARNAKSEPWPED